MPIAVNNVAPIARQQVGQNRFGSLTRATIMNNKRKEDAMPKYTAREIAHYTVDKCMSDGQPISNLQLQKIMYLMQLEYCREHGDLLFFDEFEAWQYGPVLPEIYDEFSFFGGMRIEKTYSHVIEFKESDRKTIDRVICDKRVQYPWDLVRIAHAPNSPWDVAYRKGNRTTIPNAALLAFCGR